MFPAVFSSSLPAVPMALLADGGWRALPLARATAVGWSWVMSGMSLKSGVSSALLYPARSIDKGNPVKLLTASENVGFST